MSAALTLENRLLLACARSDPDAGAVAALIRSGPDWQSVLRKA